MSINKMLIDATHPEETRVVVLRENRVEEFDYESAARKLLRGSIYLAKITRVEPSLQAAFVDYGGNRHGFLAFAEIHPDYYQIPHADKIALLEQESRDQAAYDNDLDTDEDDQPDQTQSAPTGHEDDPDGGPDAAPEALDGEPVSAKLSAADSSTDVPDDHDFEANAIDVTSLLPDAETTAAPSDSEPSQRASSLEARDDVVSAEVEATSIEMLATDTHVHITADDDTADDSVRARDNASRQEDDDDSEDSDDDDVVESLNDDNDDEDMVETSSRLDDDDEEAESAPVRQQRAPRPRRRARQYKIQEVIKRRQIVLIQVVKEERGNKGAALTTYLSLAGRYTVLMPNTARGGGISRKITNVQDRKRLKAIAQELEVPEGMGLIIRTAGAARTKQEIKRDFEYLLRLWENVRSLTLESTAPSLVYEEGNLIKRSIRDLYTKEIDDVIVAGDQAHAEAKGFMRMLMPSHAKNVIKHEDKQSLFAKYRIETQLNQMFSPNVQLKSGGYLVINQTEALVAIDVNSGKSTREFSIEETALNTNLEAAEELSRQLKLRDLAGLIVVDFIDMEEKRNNRAVERCLKDALRADRARIQVGRISHFGLLEMSRQRLRTGVLEGSTAPCAHCQGSGIIRSIESVSLAVLRGIEDALVAGKMASCVASCSDEVALYLLNQKRTFIQELEERYNVVIHIRSSSKQQGANFLIEPLFGVIAERPRTQTRDAVNIDTGFTSDRIAANDDETEEPVAETEDSKPRRRRRRRGGRRDDTRDADDLVNDLDDGDDDSDDADDNRSILATPDVDAAEASSTRSVSDADSDEDRPRRSRRRGRRGGRRHREQRNGSDVSEPGSEQPAFISMDDEEQHAGITDEHQAHPTVSCDAPSEADTSTATVVSTSVPNVAAVQVVTEPTISSSSSNTDADAEVLTQEPAQEPSDQPAPEFESIAARLETLVQPASSPPADIPALSQDEPQLDAKADPSPAPTDDKTTDEPSAASDAGAETAPDDKIQSRTARSQPVASEPVRQRVTVGPNQGATAETPASPAGEDTQQAPSRRGWWQRQFGG